MCSRQNPPPMYDWASTEVFPRDLDTHLPWELAILDSQQFVSLYHSWIWKFGSVATVNFIWKGKERALGPGEALRNPCRVFPAETAMIELSGVGWCRGDRPQTTPVKHTPVLFVPHIQEGLWDLGRSGRWCSSNCKVVGRAAETCKDVQGPFRRQKLCRAGTGKACDQGLHHSFSEKCKSESQWGTISCQSKSLQTINAGEGAEKKEPSYTVGGNAN